MTFRTLVAATLVIIAAPTAACRWPRNDGR